MKGCILTTPEHILPGMVAHDRIVGVLEFPSLPIVELTLDAAIYPPPESGYSRLQVSKTQTLTSVTIDDAIARWVAVCAADGQADTETSRKALAIRRFADRAGWVSVTDMTTESANAAKAAMIGASSKTIANQVCQLRRFSAFCVDQGWLKADPCLPVKAPRIVPGDGVRALSTEEVEAVLRAAKPYRRPYYLIAAWTGLRAGECRGLEWKDVYLNADHPYLVLPPELTKARKQATIPIPKQAIGAFASIRPEHPKPNDPVFESVPTLKTFNADLARAGVPKHDERGRSAGIHSLRKHLATALANSGADIYTAQAMLRHASINTTRQSYIDDSLMGLAGKIVSALSGGTGAESREIFASSILQDLTPHSPAADDPTSEGSRGNAEPGRNKPCGFDSHRAHSFPSTPPTRPLAGPANVAGLSESERLALLRVILDLMS